MVSHRKTELSSLIFGYIEQFSTTVERVMALDNSSTGSDAALELASFWLNRCLTTHEKCRGSMTSTDAAFIPTRVVDVGSNEEEIRLVETAKELHGEEADRRFVALSHCWGAGNPFHHILLLLS
jgi:hypothetical protein